MIYNNIDLKISILSEAMQSEILDFNKLLGSINVVQESGMIVIQENVFKTLWDKIKDLWDRFKKWFKKIVGLIKEKFGKAKTEAQIKEEKIKSDKIKETFKEAKQKIDNGELKTKKETDTDEGKKEDELDQKVVSWEEEFNSFIDEYIDDIQKSMNSIYNSFNTIKEKAEAGDEAMQKNLDFLNDVSGLLNESSVITEEKGYRVNIPALTRSDSHNEFMYFRYDIKFDDDTAVKLMEEAYKSLLGLATLDEDQIVKELNNINLDSLKKCVEDGLIKVNVISERYGTRRFHEIEYIQQLDKHYEKCLRDILQIEERISKFEYKLSVIVPKDNPNMLMDDFVIAPKNTKMISEYFNAYVNSGNAYLTLCRTRLEMLKEYADIYKHNLQICNMFATTLEADLHLHM